WANTTKDPESWVVIKRDNLESLVDRLAKQLKKENKDTSLVDNVRAVWDRGLRRIWGDQPPLDYIMPDMDGYPFTIALPGGDRQVVTPNGTPRGRAKLSPPNLLSDALTNGLGWQLVYTGKTTEGQGRGLPLYWIVEHLDSAQQGRRAGETEKAKKLNAQMADAGLADYAPLPVARVALAGL